MKTAQREIEELHLFFQQWFNGDLEDTDENFQRFAGVMAEDFEIITPAGLRVLRAELLLRLRAAHSTQRDSEPPLRIWVENVQARPLAPELIHATYEEWQETGGEVKGRLSTALLRSADGTPNNLGWVHVHEVWLPSS